MCYCLLMSENKKLTHDQAAFVLNVSRQTIYNMQERGDLPTVITDAAIEEHVSNKRIEADRIETRHNFVKEQDA